MITSEHPKPGAERSSGGHVSVHGRGFLKLYLPVIAWMIVIFLASTDSFSASNTSRIVRPLLLWLFPGIRESSIDYAHFLIRKSAHFTEYAILALIAARAFLGSSNEALRRQWVAASLALVAVYSLLDEYHQSFVPSRGPSILDSCLDTTGGAAALCALYIWRTLRSRTRQEGFYWNAVYAAVVLFTILFVLALWVFTGAYKPLPSH